MKDRPAPRYTACGGQMPQLFHPSTNTISKVSILGGVFVVAFLLWLFAVLSRSSWATQVNVAREQPVQFSHKHHVDDVGLDCRYCHTTVERSAFAGIPPTKTCMNCHSQLWVDSPELEPVRASFRTDESLQWLRVHDLPDFVYFNHGIHIHKGVGCVTCHGRVDQMPLISQHASLQMTWCLECHRAPERFVRPREEVFSMDWEPPGDQLRLGRKLVRDYDIRSAAILTSCDTCHR